VPVFDVELDQLADVLHVGEGRPVILEIAAGLAAGDGGEDELAAADVARDFPEDPALALRVALLAAADDDQAAPPPLLSHGGDI
jgi:hypothetical protein